MKIPADALISALLHPRLHLSGTEDGAVTLHCGDHFDGGRPLAYYDSSGDVCADPAVPNVSTIPSLWAQAADHLAAQHRET